MGKEYTRRVSILADVPTLGPLLLFDDFGSGFKWSGSGDGADYVVSESTDERFSGNAALKLVTRTTGTAIDDEAVAQLTTHILPNKVVRVETVLRWDDNEKIRAVGVKLLYYDVTNRHEAGAVYDSFSNELQIYDAAGNWTLITGGELHALKDAWHRLIFEADFRNDVYGEVALDNLSIDGSSTSCDTNTDGTGQQLEVQLLVVTETAHVRTVYFDNIAILQKY